jgi:hypothetical protein
MGRGQMLNGDGEAIAERAYATSESYEEQRLHSAAE